MTPSPITAAVRAFAEEVARKFIFRASAWRECQTAKANSKIEELEILAEWVVAHAAQFTPALGEDDAVMADAYNAGAREGWMRCGVYHVDLDFENEEHKVEGESRWPIRSRTPTVGTDWIPWHGGVRPVAPQQRVEIQLRNGVGTGRGRADQWAWQHENDPSDIIAYRIPPQESDKP